MSTLAGERRLGLRSVRAHGRPLVGPYWFIVPAVVMLSTVYLGPMIYAMMASGTFWVLTEPGSEHLPAALFIGGAHAGCRGAPMVRS